jgi:hypothetical protein
VSTKSGWTYPAKGTSRTVFEKDLRIPSDGPGSPSPAPRKCTRSKTYPRNQRTFPKERQSSGHRLSSHRRRPSPSWLLRGPRPACTRLIMGLSAGMVVQRTPAKRMFAPSELPSASLASRDILFRPLDTGRNPAECRPLGSFIRTTRTGSEAHFGPFSVSLRPHSLTQPNHAHFGTVIGTSTDQWVRASPKERSLEEPPSGEGNTARTVRYRYGPSSSAAFNEPKPSGRGKPCLSGARSGCCAGW